MSTISLFDKYVDLQFYGKSNNPKFPDFSVITPGSPNSSFPTKSLPPGASPLVLAPTMNRKPEITITGTFVNTVGVPGLSIRVTNLAAPFPIWLYADKFMDSLLVVEAGYISDPRTAAQFKGKIMTASEEKPGPDSITNITLLLGEFNNYMTNPVPSHTFSGGSTIGDVVNFVIPYMNNTSQFFSYKAVDSPSDRALSYPLMRQHYSTPGGSVNDIFNDLKNEYLLNIQVFGELIRVTHRYMAFTESPWELNYVTSATKDAASYHIKAPWIPGILPNDQIKFNPKIFNQSLGGAQAGPVSAIQNVITVSFEFSTTGRTNTMELFTLDPPAPTWNDFTRIPW